MYREMLKQITDRMLFIKEASLGNDVLNQEWRILLEIQGKLIKAIKLEEEIDKICKKT